MTDNQKVPFFPGPYSGEVLEACTPKVAEEIANANSNSGKLEIGFTAPVRASKCS